MDVKYNEGSLAKGYRYSYLNNESDLQTSRKKIQNEGENHIKFALSSLIIQMLFSSLIRK